MTLTEASRGLGEIRQLGRSAVLPGGEVAHRGRPRARARGQNAVIMRDAEQFGGVVHRRHRGGGRHPGHLTCTDRWAHATPVLCLLHRIVSEEETNP
jgi:hypothetical protein